MLGFDATRIEGLERATALLERAAKNSADLRVPFGVFNKSLERFMVQRFETAGARGGMPWKPLAASTREWRKDKRSNPGGNRGGVMRPLWNTGRLRASLIKASPESIRVITRDYYARGTFVPGAAAHQLGGKSGRPPRREIFPVTMEPIWARQIEALVAPHVEGGNGA